MVRVRGEDGAEDLVLALKRISKNHMAKSKEVKHLQNERKILDVSSIIINESNNYKIVIKYLHLHLTYEKLYE